MVDEVNVWREKRTEERYIFSAIISTLKYANRYFLEGGSFVASKTTATGFAKPLISTRFGTLFRYNLFYKIDYKRGHPCIFCAKK